MQAIKTTFCGPTDTRGPRIRASCERGSLYIPWDNALEPEANHVAAADALCRRFVDEDKKKWGDSSWSRPRACGALRDCYVHAFVQYVS